MSSPLCNDYDGGATLSTNQTTYGLQNVPASIIGITSLEGSIGSGKTTVLKAMKDYICQNRLDATRRDHYDPTNPNKLYILTIEEPVHEWSIPAFTARMVRETEKLVLDEHGDRRVSIMDLFYNDPAAWGFIFQINAFTTRVKSHERAFNSIIDELKADGPHRILVISERFMEMDAKFFENVCRDSYSRRVEWNLYQNLHGVMCNDIMRRLHKHIIYLPVRAETCHRRILGRGRECEKNIPMEYLRSLDEMHDEMLARFVGEHGEGTVSLFDELTKSLSHKEICDIIHRQMDSLLRDFRQDRNRNLPPTTHATNSDIYYQKWKDTLDSAATTAI